METPEIIAIITFLLIVIVWPVVMGLLWKRDDRDDTTVHPLWWIFWRKK